MRSEWPIIDLRDGSFSCWGMCNVWGHDYLRIPESPNGICLVCGHIAQDMLDKVHKIALYKRMAEEWKLKRRVCAICGKEIEWTRWFYSKKTFDGNHVCGTRHKYEYERNWILSIKPNNGGTNECLPFKWPFSEIRPIILDRDKRICQKCAMTETKFTVDTPEGYVERTNLEVDHILPRSQGGSDHPANLITKCYDCHKVKTKNDIKKLVLKNRAKNVAKLEQFL